MADILSDFTGRITATKDIETRFWRVGQRARGGEGLVRWKRYTIRLREGPLSSLLDKQPNRTEFIRIALENAAAGRSGGGASTGVPEELANRLARLEEMLQRLPRLEKTVAGLGSDMNEILSRLSGLQTPPAFATEPAQDRPDDGFENGPTPEQMRKFASSMRDFGQPKGGDKA